MSEYKFWDDLPKHITKKRKCISGVSMTCAGEFLTDQTKRICRQCSEVLEERENSYIGKEEYQLRLHRGK